MTEINLKDANEQLSHCEVSECQMDNEGQLVYYTGIFRWPDGTLHDKPEHDWIANG
jgi:hypothetical protein